MWWNGPVLLAGRLPVTILPKVPERSPRTAVWGRRAARRPPGRRVVCTGCC